MNSKMTVTTINEGIKISEVGRENLRKIIDLEFPLGRYVNRLERRWGRKFSRLFGDRIKPASVKKWVDSEIQSLKPESVEALAIYYFGGIEREELEEWLSVPHADINLAISSLRAKAQQRNEIKAELNKHKFDLDLSSVPTHVLISEIMIRLERLKALENIVPLYEDATEVASCHQGTVGLVSSFPNRAKIMLSLSSPEKKILQEIIDSLEKTFKINVFQRIKSHLPDEVVDSLFDVIINEMNGSFPREQLDIFAKAIPRISKFYTNPKQFSLDCYYSSWSCLQEDLILWLQEGNGRKKQRNGA